jgi:hypothetical protein
MSSHYVVDWSAYGQIPLLNAAILRQLAYHQLSEDPGNVFHFRTRKSRLLHVTYTEIPSGAVPKWLVWKIF